MTLISVCCVKKSREPRKKSGSSLENINLYLLHLCLIRQYLDLEFRDIEPTLPFKYSLERILDDFILLAVFVGNDFLPNLPDLHIHENGLERLFRAARLALPNEFPARDRAFITKLSEELHLDVGWDEYDQDQNLVTWRLPRLAQEGEGGEEPIVDQDGSTSNSEWEDEASGDDDEAYAAVDRVLKKYEKVPVVDLDTEGSFDERYEKSVKDKIVSGEARDIVR